MLPYGAIPATPTRLQASLPPEGERLDFGDYRVLVKPGTVPALVISVAGIGNPFADAPSGISMAFEWQGARIRNSLLPCGTCWTSRFDEVKSPGWTRLLLRFVHRSRTVRPRGWTS